MHKPSEGQIAAVRQEIAQRQRDEYLKAVEACGPGRRGYGRWTITDRLGLLPPRVVYCCRRRGELGWHPDVHGLDEETGLDLEERLPTGYFRFMICFASVYLYRPLSAERLRKRRQRRQEQRERERPRTLFEEPPGSK